MALKFKFKDEHGILQIDMSPTSSPRPPDTLTDPKFDTINHRFGQYDIFGGKYDLDGGEAPHSLFRSRYNSVEEELANTPYAFASRRSVQLNSLKLESPSRDLEDDRFFTKCDDAFTVTRLSDVQDRYFNLSRDTCVSSDGAFRVLADLRAAKPASAVPLVPTAKRKREKSFAILTETPSASRPTSPRSLPVDLRQERVSPFKGRGFREETSRHNTPKTSTCNSRASSPPRRRTNSLSKIDKMAQAATLPLPVQLTRPHSPRNFLKQNIEEVRELSELNREKHEAEAEKKRIEEEEALLVEMGLLDKKSLRSRSSSRSNSPSKIKLRSRSNSPSAILHFQNIPADSKEFINAEDGLAKPVTHRSRLRSVSKSQPQSNDGSPKHSKIPKRQNSVSPTRRDKSVPRRPLENRLNKNQRFISNSTSSIHETIRVGSQVHDKRAMSKSTQHLNISPAHIKGKPPISPGRGGPPPSNKTINAKRLSPIVGTPNKSPTDDLKPTSAKTSAKPSPVPKKPIKTAGNTPATSRLNSRQPSRVISRDPSPDKRTKTPASKSNQTKPVSRTPRTKSPPKPVISNKPEPKKPISRTNSIKSLTRTPSTKTLNEKPPILKKTNSKRDLADKTSSSTKINEAGAKKEQTKDIKKKGSIKAKDADNNKKGKLKTTTTETDEIQKQDNETQYDKHTNEKGELVIMTKKSVVSMTTAAITSQPLEVVTTVTNQLPAALEKAREKGIFERLSSKDSLVGKEEEKSKEITKTEPKENKTETKEHKAEAKDTHHGKDKEKEKVEDKRPPPKPAKSNHDRPLFTEDHIRLKPLQPPYNNPQVERVKQKIDDILKEPEISPENILTASAKSREAKNTFKSVAEKTKNDITEAKDEISAKLIDIKDQAAKQNEKMVSEIRSEVTKIVDSIITPVEEPTPVVEKEKEQDKPKEHEKEKEKEKVEIEIKNIQPIVMVVNEKKNNITTEIVEKVNETLVKGDADVEVQSSNISTPPDDKMAVENKMAEDASDKSAQSNGGFPGQSTLLRFPQSTSTTPKPPARTRKEVKKSQSNEETETTDNADIPETTEPTKQPNLCQRIMGKCKTKCCPCCVKGAEEIEEEAEIKEEMKEDKLKKMGIMDKMNCCKKKKEEEETIRNIEEAAGKASIEFENETKRKPKLRDVLCGCCGRRRRVSDTSMPQNVEAMSPVVPLTPTVVGDTGCCGRRKSQVERRDSILSDRPPNSCCNNRLCTWLRGMCRRRSEHSSSRRTSEFSKNKSLSPTLPPEDTRKKLDTSLVEHTSVMRGAIPVLPIALAYFCLLCNVIVPGLGTIFSGLFCLCFGIPRFGVHDGAKHRMGSFLINLLVGCGQLFTVLFCLVGWGWSIWWGVIMVKTARKYRKLKAEAALEEGEAQPPITANNHTRA